MLNEILNAVLPIIINCLITVLTTAAGIAIPYLFKLLKEKLGDVKFKKAISAAAYSVRVLVSYFESNPDAEKTAANIISEFEEEILKLIPSLTSEQLEFLFKSVLSDIISALGIPSDTFAAADTLVFSGKQLKRKKGLFE